MQEDAPKGAMYRLPVIPSGPRAIIKRLANTVQTGPRQRHKAQPSYEQLARLREKTRYNTVGNEYFSYYQKVGDVFGRSV